jgi:hypothetical protein
MILHSKVTLDGGGSVTRPTRREKLYEAELAIFVYSDGRIEIGKNKNGNHGDATLEDAIHHFSMILAKLKLKNTKLDMFKEGLCQLLHEEITNTLKGDYYERAICAKSAGDGSNCGRST